VSVVDFAALHRDITTAGELLKGNQADVSLEQLRSRLRQVDDVLAEFVADQAVPDDVATRLGRLRDDLSSHVLAASTLDELNMPCTTVTEILKRGISAACSTITTIARDCSARPSRTR
jgi:hypothetical protein